MTRPLRVLAARLASLIIMPLCLLWSLQDQGPCAMRPITASRAEEMSIGALSRLTGVNIETIRYYERIKMLPIPPRTASDRVFTGRMRRAPWPLFGARVNSVSLPTKSAHCCGSGGTEFKSRRSDQQNQIFSLYFFRSPCFPDLPHRKRMRSSRPMGAANTSSPVGLRLLARGPERRLCLLARRRRADPRNRLVSPLEPDGCRAATTSDQTQRNRPIVETRSR